MRILLVVLALILSAVVWAQDTQRTYEIGDPIPGKRIAVMNLNVSGEYADQVKEWLPALIEDRLLKEGWTLVVRGERMQHIQQERGLDGVKPETKLPVQEILGATAFIELNARVQVKDIQGIIGFKYFTLGDYAKASVDLNGQVVDPATGVLKSSITVGGSASGVKTGLVVTLGDDWRIGAGGYNIAGVRNSLVGKAADGAAAKLIAKLKSIYPSIPGQGGSGSAPAIMALPSTILITLAESDHAFVGDRYGVYRDDRQIAEAEVIKITGKQVEAKIVSYTDIIRPDDKARKIPVAISAE